jgi:small-conductance mechanosensitive channel
MEDQDAAFLYKWILRILFISGFFTGASFILRQIGVSSQLYLLMYSLSGVVYILALVIMAWQSRKRVAQAIWTDDTDARSGGFLRAAFARNWHYFAILYLLVAGGIWTAKVLNGENVTVLNLFLSIFLIPIIIGVDQWVQRLLKIASGESRETIDLSGDEPTKIDDQAEAAGKMNLTHYVPLIRRFFRIFLIAFLFFFSLRLWGIDISIGRMFTRSALSIVFILLLSFITWQLIKARIDQKLKEEMPEDDEAAEEGGAGGSRMGTLLVLLRKFVLTVMFVIVALIILASLGINIGPLIAGAGVIGLAIGFGAQTLVKDIIAGVFFLIDDAFRVGDFIEVSGTKGSVEHISLRSLRLRNAKGPVHTIPFGSMGTVTNMSRDYIITKLDFRVRYDTNVDKVRKIIKKINKTIQKDPEMGPNLLDKIKSQGVKELDDSAMIMRLKFKTIPGEQFVIRREIFRMIQESFAENGIEFAHRNVTVYLPPDKSAGEPDKKAAIAGAAAAAAAAQAEEAKELPKG